LRHLRLFENLFLTQTVKDMIEELDAKSIGDLDQAGRNSLNIQLQDLVA